MAIGILMRMQHHRILATTVKDRPWGDCCWKNCSPNARPGWASVGSRGIGSDWSSPSASRTRWSSSRTRRYCLAAAGAPSFPPQCHTRGSPRAAPSLDSGGGGGGTLAPSSGPRSAPGSDRAHTDRIQRPTMSYDNADVARLRAKPARLSSCERERNRRKWNFENGKQFTLYMYIWRCCATWRCKSVQLMINFSHIVLSNIVLKNTGIRLSFFFYDSFPYAEYMYIYNSNKIIIFV